MQMKGMVFREFVDMVEAQYSPQMLDSLIQQVQPASGGAYTTVGTYDYGELLALVGALSAATQVSSDALLQRFGHHLALAFARNFHRFFEAAPDLFAFLQSVENHIHSEVLKLYPDAQLPHFTDDASESGVLRLIYRSSRPLEYLALGLIEGSARHYGEAVGIAMHTQNDAQGRHTEFRIQKRAATP